MQAIFPPWLYPGAAPLPGAVASRAPRWGLVVPFCNIRRLSALFFLAPLLGGRL